MLIDINLKNFYSFKDAAGLGVFPYRRIKKHKHHIYQQRILKQVAIFGDNNSGKSNLFRLLKLIKQLVMTGELPEELKYTTFEGNKEEQSVQIIFMRGTTTFWYSVTLKQNKIVREVLGYPGKKNRVDKPIFERIIEDGQLLLYFGAKVKRGIPIPPDVYQDNKSILSELAEVESPYQEDIQKALQWFIDLEILTASPDSDTHIKEMYSIFERAKKEPKVFIVDGMGLGVHPKMLLALLESFSSTNTSKGQLVFNTHNTTILDGDDRLLRKDEVYYIEKNQQGESRLYSLCNFKGIDKMINCQKNYLNGRFGAVPFVKAITEYDLSD